MSKYTYISQVDQRDCGVAALAMVLKHYGSTYSLARLRELAQTSREGTSALGLVEAAKELGLETQALRADMKLFEENLDYPFIAHVIKDGNLQHYYTVFGQKDGQLIIGDPDPSRKLVSLSQEEFAKEWTGVVLFFKPGESYRPHKEELSGLLTFLPTLLQQKRLIVSIVALSFVITLINIIGSYYLQTVLDQLIPQAAYSVLTIISLGLCFSYVLQQVLTYFKDYLLHKLGNDLSAAVILPYIKHVLSLPMSFFSTRRTGEITSRFEDASTIIDALASTILSVFLDVSIVVMLSIALILQNPILFGMTLTVVPLYVLIIFAFYNLFEQQNYQVMEANSQVNTAIIDDLRGIETVKSLRVEEKRYQDIENKFHDYLGKSLAKARLQLRQDGLKTSVQLVSNIFVLWYGAYLVMNGQLSVGQLITYNMLLSYFTTPLLNIINLQGKIQQAKVANNRLQEVYVVDKEEPGQLEELEFESLNIKKVGHRFSYQQETLHDLDFSLNKGEKLAFMGQSGSGKTTLAKILAGYYQTSSGQIFLDNRQLSSAELRQLVTYIPQQSYVFTGTILENLLLGLTGEIDDERLVEVCRQAEILEDIQKMPLGFQTQVSEDGGLSGGQKQRLAIARALLSEQPILIFDEATSGLDSETESKVMANLAKLNRTMIFIAHRDSVRHYVSRLVTLSDGQIDIDRPQYKVFQIV